MGSKDKFDIIFYYSGIPLPAMLEVVDCASKNGKKCLLLIDDRGTDDLKIDKSLVSYEVRYLNISCGSAFTRLLNLVKLIPRIFQIICGELKTSGLVMSSNFDTLFKVFLVSFVKKFEIRHQIRDLHPLQLSSTVFAKTIQMVERVMLKRVSMLMVSSKGFFDSYYSKIYNGEMIVLENIPRSDVWKGFEKKRFKSNELIIGFIGIIRYKRSILRLIKAVESLSKKGLNVKVKFAGGSLGDDLRDITSNISDMSLFEFHGPFIYSQDIQRLHSDIDIIFAVYDEHDLNCKLALPNKIYESMITKIPVLVAANTYVGNQVVKLGIGDEVSIDCELDLEKKLQCIFSNKENWFTRSLENLESDLTSEIYRKYRIALNRSVDV